MMQNGVIMLNEGMYGVAHLPVDVFKKLNSDYFIIGSDDYEKFMCANDCETEHLKSLGVVIGSDIYCDWYQLVSAGSPPRTL